MLMGAASNNTMLGREIERAAGPNRNAPHMRACVLALRNHRLDGVSSLKPERALAPHKVSARKSVLRYPRALVAPSASSHDTQGGHRRTVNVLDLSDAQRIERMPFRNGKPRTIELRMPATRRMDWQSKTLQRTKQCPTC